MRSKGIIVAIIVFVSIPFIFTCSEEKTASIEGNEDIVAVLQKIPQCYENPDTAMQIYADDAMLKRQDPTTGKMVELSGPMAIGEYRKERGKAYRSVGISISSIEEEDDKAHVEYSIITQLIKGEPLEWKLRCSADMVKQGQTWKIQKETVQAF